MFIACRKIIINGNMKKKNNKTKILWLIIVFLFGFQNSATLLMAACLFATIYASLGMNTVYYRNGERCEVCAEEHVPYRQQTQTYYPSGEAQRVVYRTEERIITRPSSSSSYIVNRADTASYSDSNFIH